MIIDDSLIRELIIQAEGNPRLRKNLDMRTSTSDTSQRMINVLMPGTKVPVHRHKDTSETVICLCGSLDEIIFEEISKKENDKNERDILVGESGDSFLVETQRIRLNPKEGNFGFQVPKGAWHTVEVIEPSAIFEAKDGAYELMRDDDLWKSGGEVKKH